MPFALLEMLRALTRRMRALTLVGAHHHERSMIANEAVERGVNLSRLGDVVAKGRRGVVEGHTCHLFDLRRGRGQHEQ
jgi:hypothetical protein